MAARVPMNIAVLGAGLSGLAAAWWLARSHQVTLFERHPQPGFTAHSVSVPGRDGQPVRVDVPLRVFYPGYYPTLVRLYDELGVASEPVSYAASFMGAEGGLYFRYRNLRWGEHSIGTWAPADALLGLRAWRIGLGLLRFRRRALAAAAAGRLAGLTIEEFVQRECLGNAVVEGFLLPAICTVCTCNTAQARGFPATVIVDYLAQGLSSQSVRRASQGADDVQQRLLAGIPALRCAARITAVRREAGGVVLRHEGGAAERFDQVVIAAQANQALRLLDDAQGDEAAALGAFRYTPVEVLTHRDATLMPARRADWSPVNLRVLPDAAGPESTIWVNPVQPALRGAPDVFQTVQPQREPRSDALLGRARFERPLVDAGSAAAWAALARLHAQPGRRVWFCGSYAHGGIPLLESAVRSAADVVQRIAAPAAPTHRSSAGLRAENIA